MDAKDIDLSPATSSNHSGEMQIDRQDDTIPIEEKGADLGVEGIEDITEGQNKPTLMNFKFIMVITGFGMAFVGSQVQPLIFAALTPLIASDLDAASQLLWFLCAQLVAIGVVAPFAGPLADLLGRKIITIAGVLSSMVGMILCAATPNATGYLAGQGLVGIGIAVQELMAISAVAEIVPLRKRGYYIAVMVSAFLPFSPGSLYGALIARTSWRYCALLIEVWNLFTAVIIFVFYNPPPRPNAAGLSKWQMLKQIDFLGGLIVTVGLIVFLVGVNSGGREYPWNHGKVIAELTVGGVLIVAFFVYEVFFAKYPMFPGRLLKHPRAFTALMVVILMAGINYIPILFFWVMQSVAVYQSDAVEIGIRTLPFGFCILGGALISSIMMSAFKAHARGIMTLFCIVQATAIGSMAAADPTNISTVWAPLSLGLTAVGGVLIPNQIIITIISPDDLIATATCLTVSLRAIGQVVGTSIFYNQFVQHLTKRTMAEVIPVALQVGIYNITTLENMMPDLVATPFLDYVAKNIPELDTMEKTGLLLDVVKVVFGEAFSRVYFISLAFGGLAVVASLCLGDLTALIDEHIAVTYF